jgi:hypothetical protein
MVPRPMSPPASVIWRPGLRMRYYDIETDLASIGWMALFGLQREIAMGRSGGIGIVGVIVIVVVILWLVGVIKL